MSYSEPLVNQLRVFFLSVGVGVPLCLLYIFLQALVSFFKSKKWAIFTGDAVFCILATFVSFFFMVIFNSGRVRLHLILGEALGFFAFYLSVGKLLLRLSQKAGEAGGKAVSFVLSPFVRVGRALGGIPLLFASAFGRMRQRIDRWKRKKKKSGKKIKFLDKIHLKNKNKSV